MEERLGSLLKKHNIENIKDLAYKMGVNYQTLYSLISGKNNNPKIDTIKKICDYFNITVDDLIYKERKLVYLNSRGESYEDALKTIDELYNISLVIRNNSAIKFLPEDADLVFNCYDGNLSDNSYVFVKSNKTNGFSIKRAVSIN